ncbi:MAG: DedA family protein [Thermoplasmata archaeon]
MNSLRSSGSVATRMHKYWYYGLTLALLMALLSSIAILNGYYHFYSLESYHRSKIYIPFSDVLAGYLGIFVSIFLLPIPDYVLLPFYGYLCSIGLFNPAIVLLASVAGAVIPVEFLLGFYAGSRLLRRILSHLRVPQESLSVATDWMSHHGNFSIFLSTFVPFFYSVASFSAGTLKMRFSSFMTASTIGFLLRYVGLEFIGYYSLFIFTSQYDYRYRYVFAGILVSSLAYVFVYKLEDNRLTRSTVPI